MQESHALQLKTRLDVFLPSNFKVVGRYSSESFKVYKGETVIAEVLSFDTLQFHLKVIASVCFLGFIRKKTNPANITVLQVNHNFTWESFCKGKETVKVKVYPGVDYAFIVALIVIVNENDAI